MTSLRRPLTFTLLSALVNVSANNLVPNPNFDSDVAHWTAIDADLKFDATDGFPNPGSAQLLSGSRSPLMLSECIAVDSSATYDLSAMVKVIQGNSDSISIFFFEGAGCLGQDVSEAAVGFGGYEFSNWTPLSLRNLAVPDSAVGSAIIEVIGFENDNLNVLLDSVRFAPSDEVFGDGFDGPPA